ncbi:hypothetical protein J2T56_003229 [Natronobacillus azotifigens]|uniref:YcxB family protein n=1 Tax=Natronobacillus azotifigens TaxID=472978 RepID=A0A9J6RGP9_9BACI|nr:hypothetical protein [Natronobacillus azotifigens]MCZ0704507.1 hypothetical protein [Natronobacillus azotifigens]
MEVHFLLSMDDIEAIQKDSVDTLPYYKKRKKVVGFVLSIIYLLLVTMMIDGYYILKILMAVVVFLLTNQYIFKYGMIAEVRRLIKNNPEIIESKCKLTINEEGFRREFDNTIQQEKWEKVTFANEDNERYFIYISELKKFVFKKRPAHLSDDEIVLYNSKIHEYLHSVGIQVKHITSR